MTTLKFPVFCRLRLLATAESLIPTEPMKCRAIDTWLDESKKRRSAHICEAFRESAARDWISQIVSLWKLDNLSVADLSGLLGISPSQASRLRNHFSTSIGVLGQWAASHNSPLPAPDHCRWSMVGIGTAVQTTTWLEDVTSTRKNRTPLPPKLSENELSLLVVLEATQLQDHWDSLTDRYESDLYEAVSDNAFIQFLDRFSVGYLRLTQQHPPAKRRFPIYFPNGKLSEDTRWQLCRDIDDLIRKLVFDGSRMWRVVDALTPWLTGLGNEGGADDEEAA
jgi:hypothetical protein